MTVTIVAVTTEGDLLDVVGKSGKPYRYGDIGDAAGDLNGGDYLGILFEQHPNRQIKEFRIVLSSPVET